MFIEQRQVGQMAVFAYLVGDEESGDALVIDPAADTDGIIAAAERRKVRIKYIVNTHGHVDHTGGNVDIKAKTGAEIIIHEEDADMLVSTPTAMLRMFCAKQSPPPIKRYGTAIASPSAGSDSRSSTPPVIPRAALFFTPTVTPSPAIRCL